MWHLLNLMVNFNLLYNGPRGGMGGGGEVHMRATRGQTTLQNNTAKRNNMGQK